jgi:hypothetical protein
MIKLEDRASVIILCLITFMGLFYSFMMLGDGFASAFLEKLGRPAPNEDTLFWMGWWGYIYLALGIGNIMALLSPASESKVFFRTMALLSFISFLRVLGNNLAVGELDINPPLIAQLLVFIGYSVILTRTNSRAGAHFGWL